MSITIEEHKGVLVMRDDLFPGGTKARFLPELIAAKAEVVYAGPFCGGAAVALSVIGCQSGTPVTLFYAQRKAWHPRQAFCASFGATLKGVPMGFLTHVRSQARKYCESTGAFLFPMGYDAPEARAALDAHVANVRSEVGTLDFIYVATGTGMLASALAAGWPEARVIATAVGLKSHWGKQEFPINVEVIEWPASLDHPSSIGTAFPCDPYYDRKAWETLQAQRQKGRHDGNARVLFWNVLGEPERVNAWAEAR